MLDAASHFPEGLVCHLEFASKILNKFAWPTLEAENKAVERRAGGNAPLDIAICWVGPDEGVAERRIAFANAQFAVSHIYEYLFSLHGWSGSQGHIRDAGRQGDTVVLVAAVPEKALDLIGIAWAPGERAELAVSKAKDLGYLNLLVPSWDLSREKTEYDTRVFLDRMRQVRLVGARAGNFENGRVKEIN